MTQVRYLFLTMCGWFFLLYNIERLIAPINIASFVYILSLVVVLCIILLPKLYQLSFEWLLLSLLILFFSLKILLDYQIGGAKLPITITEISVLGLTLILSLLIRRRLETLQELLTNLTIGQFNEDVREFSTGQGEIYREIRRARRHHRPASLLAISIFEPTAQPTRNQLTEYVPLGRFLEEVQREVLNKYISTRIANILVTELSDLAIITQRKNHFVTLLPETDGESLHEIVQRLKAIAQEKLGLQFKIGMSTFPDEAITFETMLERAEAAMENDECINNAQVKEISVDTTRSMQAQ